MLFLECLDGLGDDERLDVDDLRFFFFFRERLGGLGAEELPEDEELLERGLLLREFMSGDSDRSRLEPARAGSASALGDSATFPATVSADDGGSGGG